ncbi:unnamed protein product [Arctia plantaginis]|uniref:Uncharacterized protein n=1 Tax=Arctia plantaginis TaxID=874455 RepID=A0A8S1ALY0_ARCPL|nr:unnamed protein product [Arctia plantaginis]
MEVHVRSAILVGNDDSRQPFSSLSVCCQCCFGRGTEHPYVDVFYVLLHNSSTPAFSYSVISGDLWSHIQGNVKQCN